MLRQLEALKQHGSVTTVGFGAAPDGVAQHIEVPADLKTLPQTFSGVLNLALRRMRASELAAPAVRFALAALEGRRFDLVVANEARVLGLAHAVSRGAPVWADMHEWAPEERTQILSWKLLVAPFISHLCDRYLPRSKAVTAVCGSIADLYRSYFGVETSVVRNAGPYLDLTPSESNPDRVRLVHSGAAIRGRGLEAMIEVVETLDARYTLDLYLMPGGDGGAYLDELRRRAEGSARIVFHEPVTPAELPRELNKYDVGIFWIPPTNTNAKLTLPNKFFDYVQARLAIAVGPSPEMAALVREYSLGVVSSSWDVRSYRESLLELDGPGIESAKRAAHAAASQLSSATDARHMSEVITALLAASREAAGVTDAE
ncbi:glycosyltransferase [Ruicaihuangia caeni]|uniref:Glycosyltransferase n=1 Tax=Ruicaihuangia caeni TaxID=3042517 RepID=A0AAW6T8H4_9MICO|nr:glycosyltransferase [Klugiella sp. YN-L-19]MDI2099406.1 glycosyltransferase [Klugiella sp. YN-L-19]